MKNQVVILDFGGADVELLARKVRGLRVYCQVVSGDFEARDIYQAVHAEATQRPGGVIVSSRDQNAPSDAKPHDSVYQIGCPIWDVQQTDWDGGIEAVGDFVFGVCGLAPDWTPELFATEAVDSIKSLVQNARVISGVSGGVDSTVATALVHRAVGHNLRCILVDHGLLRKNEARSVVELLSRSGIHVHLVNAQDRFLQKLTGVSDPEEKRKIIGEEFIQVFQEEAVKLGGAEFFVQGTIYPDVIESGSRYRTVVKSHHNVGGLPEKMSLKLLEPVRNLFKDEVRLVGRELGLAPELLNRHPFPGPGLGVRVLGEVTVDKLEILREAQSILDEEIRAAGLYGSLWQCFCVIPGVRSVGVTHGKRTFGYLIAIRAVESEDAMTASWARLPYPVLDRVSHRIISEIPDVNRVVLDITSKPPSTIEWE